jgi:hypothetical protein
MFMSAVANSQLVFPVIASIKKIGKKVPEAVADILGKGTHEAKETASKEWENAIEAAEKLGAKKSPEISILSNIEKNLADVPDALKIERAVVGKDPNKIAIIGRSMRDVVEPTANALKGKGIPTKTFQPDELALRKFLDEVDLYRESVNSKTARLPSESVKNTDLYKKNVEWIREKLNQGYTILDMGDPYKLDISQGPSDFYEMEKEVIKELLR